MGSGFRTFTAGEVLTASNVQNYLMDQSVMSFAGSAARSSAIGTANFEEGMVSYLQDTNLVEVYNGTNWASVAPSGPTPGLVQIGTAISFSGVSSQSINDVFSATYKNYRVIANVTGSGTSTLRFRFRVSGADNTTSNYSFAFFGVDETGPTSVPYNGQNSAFFTIGQLRASQVNNLTFDVFNPFETARSNGLGFVNDVGASDFMFGGFTFTQTTSFTGFSLIDSANNITGNVSIYGYNA